MTTYSPPADLTFSSPCTACGEDDHDRTTCEHAPTDVRISEMSLPDVAGWRAVVTYPDGSVTTSELAYDPRNDRLTHLGIMRAGRWSTSAWRGRQPIERGMAGARAYAIAFFHGADLPPTEDPR